MVDAAPFNARTAPQCEWPHTTISLTPSCNTANSIVAISLDGLVSEYGGMTLPAVRSSNNDPGSAPVIAAVTMRESAHVMNNVVGR